MDSVATPSRDIPIRQAPRGQRGAVLVEGPTSLGPTSEFSALTSTGGHGTGGGTSRLDGDERFGSGSQFTDLETGDVFNFDKKTGKMKQQSKRSVVVMPCDFFLSFWLSMVLVAAVLDGRVVGEPWRAYCFCRVMGCRRNPGSGSGQGPEVPSAGFFDYRLMARFVATVCIGWPARTGD